MERNRRTVTRRTMLKSAAGLPALKAAKNGKFRVPPVYAELGVRPFINAAGTYTKLSGSLMPAEVHRAMDEASQAHVSIPELQAAVGERIARMLGCEAALVTAGAAAALTLGTAACVTGKDQAGILRLPDTTGMKNEVIIQKSHRFAYDHAVRAAGVRLLEVETREQLAGALSERTAMLLFLNNANPKGQIQREEFAHIANRVGVPAMIDAAADVPPLDNLRAFPRMGFHLTVFSGGKGLRGPQCSGLLLGKKDLIEAAFLNGPPHSDSLGRGTKVGKEEIVGLYRALQLFLAADQEAMGKEWERRVAVIERAVGGVPGLQTERFVPEIANHVPHLRLRWDPGRLPITPRQVIEELRNGDPRIELRPDMEEQRDFIDVGVWMMRAGEERWVGSRLREVFGRGAANDRE